VGTPLQLYLVRRLTRAGLTEPVARCPFWLHQARPARRGVARSRWRGGVVAARQV